MKDFLYCLIITLLIVFILSDVVIDSYTKESNSTNTADCIEDDCIHIVWNDDEESIPTVGTLVEVEYIDSGCVYIGPVD